jgi:[protein-PII] uridylyltransferase
VRCELNFQNGLRQDILEQDSLLEVARGLGYAEGSPAGAPPAAAPAAAADHPSLGGAERLMSDYYRHAWEVLNFARYYLETGSRGNRFLGKVRHRFFSSRLNSFLSLLDGRLYLMEEPPGGVERLPMQIMAIFSIAFERNAQVSESLAGWIRRKIAEIPLDFVHSGEVGDAFLRILAGGRNVGRILTRMHETGVLARILPEFEKLTCRVNFDGHHQFTVDEHTLRTLRELDRIETELDYPEREFQKVLSGIQDRLPLRLALLLHDIGKAGTGKHDARGTEAAVLICERLGVDEASIQTVESLIYHHLMMYRYSERTDFTDDRVVESFGRLVERVDRLSMLYLLTYIDISSVGAGTWTAWKGSQLSDLYQRTRILLETGAVPKSGKLEEALAAAGLDDLRQKKVLEHCRLIDNPAYARETIPERMAYHLDLVEKFLETGTVQVGLDEQVGYAEVTFCSRDRPHLFADFAGVLLSEGLNILGARIFSRSDGVVIDLFQVEIADRVQLDIAHRVENLRHKLGKIERRKALVGDLISERARRYRLRPPRKALFAPRVHFDNEISGSCTVIEVDAADRTGLLYDLATTLSDLGLDVRAAKVSTLVDRAHDVFYVVEPGGQKIHDAPAQRKIAEALTTSAARAVPVNGTVLETARAKEGKS